MTTGRRNRPPLQMCAEPGCAYVGHWNGSYCPAHHRDDDALAADEPPWDAYDVTCPACGAEPGLDCTDDGRPWPRAHLQRRIAGRQAAVAALPAVDWTGGLIP